MAGKRLMCKSAVTLLAVGVAAAMLAAADNEFITTWKSPTAGPLQFGGRKVVALVIVGDDDLRMSAEEALAREISARGPVGVAANRIIPREELRDKDRARTWLEKAGVEGAVIMRVADVDVQKVYSSVVFSSGYYANVWDYYGYGWTTVTPVGKPCNQMTLTVETLLYDVRSASPLWAGVTSTTDPKDTGSYMKALARDIGRRLQKEGLTAKAK